MSFYRKTVGAKGEALACSYLLDNGYTVLERNFHTRFGELDIIAEKDTTIVFVEVKTKTSDATGKPYESVSKRKIRHLQKAIQFYLLTKNYKNRKLSLDVISILLDKKMKVKDLKHFRSVDI